MLNNLFVKPEKIVKINNDTIAQITKVEIHNKHYFCIETFEKQIAFGDIATLIVNGVIKKA